jgi:hypothetical protein
MSDRAGTPDQTPDPKAEQLDTDDLDQISGGAVNAPGKSTDGKWIVINEFDPGTGIP